MKKPWKKSNLLFFWLIDWNIEWSLPGPKHKRIANLVKFFNYLIGSWVAFDMSNDASIEGAMAPLSCSAESPWKVQKLSHEN